jgi:hypothetical protein
MVEYIKQEENKISCKRNGDMESDSLEILSHNIDRVNYDSLHDLAISRDIKVL